MLGSEDLGVTKATREGSSARYEIGPIDAGYARSLASALRRVLLSSLEGSAITSVLSRIACKLDLRGKNY